MAALPARIAAFLLLVGLVACGTVVERTNASSGVGGAGGEGGASTTGSVTVSSSSGATVSSSSASGGCDDPLPEACPATAQCATVSFQCSCPGSPGSWQCSTGEQPSTLPGVAPVEGACCEEEGMYCGGFEPCGPICHCKSGAWSCKPPDACPPFACPVPVETLAGEECPERVGEICEGSGFCHYTCICELNTTGSAAWACSIPPC
jgi:hypothetical protein